MSDITSIALGALSTIALPDSEAVFINSYYRCPLGCGDAPASLTMWTFTRSSPGVALKSDDSYADFASGEPRIVVGKGILIEAAATNLLIQANNRTAAAWTKLNGSATADAAAAPDGTMSADKFAEDTANGVHRIIQICAVSSSTSYVYTENVQAAGRTRIVLLENNGPGLNAIFDLAAGEVISVSPGADAWINPLANGFFACSLRFTTQVDQTSANCQLQLVNAAGVTSYAGDNTSGVMLWNGQLEAGGRPTSPIATMAATVTREADQASYMNTGGTEGGFFAEADLPLIPVASAVLAEWSDASEDNRIVISYTPDNELAVYVATGGNPGASTVIGSGQPGDLARVGVRWTGGLFQFYFNGAATGELACDDPTLNMLSIGTNNTGGDSFGGCIRRIATFPTAPTINAMLLMTGGMDPVQDGIVRIAAANSTNAAKSQADLICDGIADQEEINAALAGPRTVFLFDGLYNVVRTDVLPIPVDPLPQPGLEVQGAILITSSHSTLIGQSRAGTVIHLGDEEQCNVIRTIGNGLEDIEMRDFTIDPNRANNDAPGQEWLENCGIKTRTTGTTRNHNIRIDNIAVRDVDGLGVYLFGDDVHLSNSHFGNADNDVAELCDSLGGSITGCTAVIDGTVGYIFGTDQAENFNISGNTIIVKAGGYVTSAVHRIWPGYYRGTVSNNIVRCEEGGQIYAIVHGYSYLTTFTGNSFQGHNYIAWGSRTRIELNTTCIFSANAVSFCNVIQKQSGSDLQTLPTDAAGKTLIVNNMFEDCEAPSADAQLVYTGNVEFTF